MHGANENRSIAVGGQTVAPGESKWVHIAIDRLPTGTVIDIPVFVHNAKRPGPTLLVQAGLHGDEINGIEIVRRMLQNGHFKVNNGAIMAVPILNVFGFLHFSRDVPDGKDVNRSFPGSKKGSMASRIAYHYTAEIMTQIDFCIDLHTGGGQLNNFPQVRYTKGDAVSEQLTKAFNAPFSFASGLIKGSFRNATHAAGVPSIVYEGGESMRFDEHAILEGMQGIINVLQHLQMVSPSGTRYVERSESITLAERKWVRAATAGMFIPNVTNGSAVKKGQHLGIISDPYAKKAKKVRAPHNGYVICINHQAVVNQGDALFHMGQ
jgi:uncharacterized protein